MTLLILGLILWTAAHVFKRVAPGARAALQERMGDASKGIFAVLLVLSVVLMVMGYRDADTTFLWGRSAATTGINNLAMLAAVALFGLGSSKSRLRARFRHPMLWGTVVWALAHLLVNGDVPSIILFGGLLAWAVVAMIGTNRRDGPRGPKPEATMAGLVMHVVATAVVFVVVALLHLYVGGLNPLPG